MKRSSVLLLYLAGEWANGKTIIDNAPFADDLIEELYSTSTADNECTSSLGVSMAMSLIYPSAIADSEVQIRNLFGYPPNMQNSLLWADTTRSITSRYQGNCYAEFDGECSGREPSLAIANSVFVDDDVALNSTYSAVVGDLVQQIDFSNEEAGRVINSWVEESTKSLIPSIVEDGSLDQWITLAINSIYLKASWVKQFSEERTNQDQFLSSPDPTPAHFMNNVESFPYSHDIEALPGYQILQHYFAGDYNADSTGLSMIFVLPPPDAENAMASSEDVLAVIPNLQNTRVAFSLPKFRYESEYKDSLKEALQNLGAEAVFDSERTENLCIQDQRCDAFIDLIVQKTLIDVNEKGVEAAAVTAIGVALTSMPPPTAVLFLANRPFQFFLYDEVDDVVLFEGLVTNPGIVEGSEAPMQGSHNDADFWTANFGITAETPTPTESGCPTPGEGICTADYTPVMCGDGNSCEYTNACNAELAGFNADEDCTLKEEPVAKPETIECPPMEEGMCTMEFMPVLCGDNNCEYDNGCNAELAGFNADEDCTLKEEPVAQPETTECPPMAEGMCTMEFMPVLCGDNNCEYDNGCNAEFAGFNADEDCTLMEEPVAQPETMECPPMAEGMCTMEFMPVLCGDNNCEYDNGCNAELAGFNADEDCALKDEPVAQPETTDCPSMAEGMCTMEFMPVLCGVNKCEYDNGCNAELAGFNAKEDCGLKEEAPAKPEETEVVPPATTVPEETSEADIITEETDESTSGVSIVDLSVASVVGAILLVVSLFD